MWAEVAALLLGGYNPGASQYGGGWTLPAANRNLRWSLNDDLSWTRGRHNMKFGFYAEWASKTEPQSTNYMGNYAFGHNAQNPLSTGNGYANALIGVFNTYTELTNRVDRDRRHWQTEGYLQDSWRVTPGFTLDYGVRLTHSGGTTTRASPRQASSNPVGIQIRRPGCSGRCARRACPAIRPARRTTSGRWIRRTRVSCFRARSSGIWCPAPGRRSMAWWPMATRGCDRGSTSTSPPLVASPRVGFAWDINGSGKQALRASSGNLLRHPVARLGGLRVTAAGSVHPRGPVGDVRRHRELREHEPQVRRDADRRPGSWRGSSLAREVLQRQRRPISATSASTPRPKWPMSARSLFRAAEPKTSTGR